ALRASSNASSTAVAATSRVGSIVEPCHTILAKHGRTNLGSPVLPYRGAFDVAASGRSPCQAAGPRVSPAPPARAPRCRSSVVEHPLGKGEVESSILSGSTTCGGGNQRGFAPIPRARRRRLGQNKGRIQNCRKNVTMVVRDLRC